MADKLLWLEMLTVQAFLTISLHFILSHSVVLDTEVRWCVINDNEMEKCTDLKLAIAERIRQNRTYSPDYIGKPYKDLPTLFCVRGMSQFDCMQMVMNGEADLIQLETSLSYTAGQYYTMIPLMVEKYKPGQGDEGLDFYAVAVLNASKADFDINTLQGKKVCSPGVGQAAGWVYPVSFLLENDYMQVAQCNVPVKSAAFYFGDMCAPDGLARYYNTFGTNPVTVCKACVGKDEDFCTINDPYSGYAGAIDCLINSNSDVAFVRHTTIENYLKNTNNTLTLDNFKLLCQDGRKVDVASWETCNWGRIASHVIMTSTIRLPKLRDDYKDLLTLLSLDFGVDGLNKDLFELFTSVKYGKQNLMFSDETVMLKDVADVAGGSRNSYYTWAVIPELQPFKMDLKSRLNVLNKCPVPLATWCVISDYEMMKCEKMIMAFAARNLKPDLNCIKGDGVIDCLKKIRLGDADLITLDAADVYMAGKHFGLVPIAAEDYSGKNETGYYAVAVARKRFVYMLLHNLKQRRSCHTAVMSAAGWVIPVDMLIETGQINVLDSNAYLAVSQYFSKSCVPGILDRYFNPHNMNPVNLCEACSTAGPRRCLRNDDELYYGSSGAFRCLVEVGGDVAFVRHMTVHENTDGLNLADWARNRRSDDYELLCKDGKRSSIDKWNECNLGYVPSNAVMTAGFKSDDKKQIYWTLLSYAQQFFDADGNQDFKMFDSAINHRDLIFQDATVRLVPVTDQTYEEYLGPEFVRMMERMKLIDKVTGQPSSDASIVTPTTHIVLSISLLLLLRLTRVL
ncbi:hypothetical protein HELRODRAFT_99809 [Helobdella robusta]|uniref:Transferrin-like domain-containing protein n=1 Tax=Helobdella robusta TaxID=6412 RepID=T1G9V3_HELRO|nr:hypothetical protein HELRODRAFT_99809 [Helobdella robusta]ESO04012.1 hypothetical protein HELRODRAFT_99809 [Helobdella robusta]